MAEQVDQGNPVNMTVRMVADGNESPFRQIVQPVRIANLVIHPNAFEKLAGEIRPGKPAIAVICSVDLVYVEQPEQHPRQSLAARA